MMADVHIREAGIDDIGDMISLLKELFSIEADFSFDETRQRCGLKMMIEPGESRCVRVASAQNRVVGMVSIQTLVSTAEGGRSGIVEDLVVTSEWRGKGIGRRLLEAIFIWARQQGMKRLQLLADRTNVTALEFYRGQGWTATQLICLRKKEFYDQQSLP